MLGQHVQRWGIIERIVSKESWMREKEKRRA
jgi:hypothetical protein